MFTDNPTLPASSQERLDSHCGIRACLCSHSGGCYKGWIDSPEQTHQTSACPVCRPDLAHTLDQIPPPGQRNIADQARLLNRAKSDHQEGAA